jgi:hypothetical protein
LERGAFDRTIRVALPLTLSHAAHVPRFESGLSDFQTELWILMMFNPWHRRFASAAVPLAAGAVS